MAQPAEITIDAPLPAIESDLYCPKCGYNLRGLTGNRCPECGDDIAIIRERKSQIPWLYRDKEGTLHAYWKTVWLVMGRNQRFCLEIGREIDEGEARRFRRVTLLFAYVPFVLVTLALTEQSGRTTLMLTILCPSKEARDATIASGMEHGATAVVTRLGAEPSH